MVPQDYPADYEAPVFLALVEPVRMFGIHRETALCIWGLSIMLVFSGGPTLSAWWPLLVAGALNALLAFLTHKDPDFIAVLVHALLSPNRLEP